jgi:hypothetical protein
MEPSSEVKILDGVEYRPDRNGYYRNKRGHLMKGQNLARLRKEKNEKKREVGKATPGEIRAYFRDCLPEVMDVIIEQAKAGCVNSQRLIMDKVAPNLKSVTVEGQQALPTLIIQQLIQGDSKLASIPAETLRPIVDSESPPAMAAPPESYGSRESDDE